MHVGALVEVVNTPEFMNIKQAIESNLDVLRSPSTSIELILAYTVGQGTRSYITRAALASLVRARLPRGGTHCQPAASARPSVAG